MLGHFKNALAWVRVPAVAATQIDFGMTSHSRGPNGPDRTYLEGQLIQAKLGLYNKKRNKVDTIGNVYMGGRVKYSHRSQRFCPNHYADYF